jgi:hypothetical protein
MTLYICLKMFLLLVTNTIWPLCKFPWLQDEVSVLYYKLECLVTNYNFDKIRSLVVRTCFHIFVQDQPACVCDLIPGCQHQVCRQTSQGNCRRLNIEKINPKMEGCLFRWILCLWNFNPHVTDPITPASWDQNPKAQFDAHEQCQLWTHPHLWPMHGWDLLM